jgi:hypothetical protein
MTIHLHDIRRVSANVYELDVEWEDHRDWYRFEVVPTPTTYDKGLPLRLIHDGMPDEFHKKYGRCMRAINGAVGAFSRGEPVELPLVVDGQQLQG